MDRPSPKESTRSHESGSPTLFVATEGVAAGSFLQRAVAGPIARYVERIWLETNNRDDVFQILPDGCVDVVFELGADAGKIFAYGSTTRPALAPLYVGRQYLGVRFQPGMARHFLDHSPAALTDQQIAIDRFLGVDLEKLARDVRCGAGLLQIETALLNALASCQPDLSLIDRVVRFMLANHGDVTVTELASQCGKSVRQFERLFVAALGLSPKTFCSILRMRKAMDIIQQHKQVELAGLAAATGYTDQSHMNKNFIRLTGRSPGSFR